MRGGNISYRRGSGKQGAQFSLRNISTKTRIKVSLDHGRPVFLVETKISGVLTELLGKDRRLTPGFIDQMEREIEAETRERLIALIDKMQQIKSDAIGFGLKLRAQHYDFWKEHDWKKLFPTSRLQVKVKAHLIRDGVIR